MTLVAARPLDLRAERQQPSSSTACKSGWGVGEWGAIHQSPCYGRAHPNGCMYVKGWKYVGFCSLFGNVQKPRLLVILFSIPHPQPKSYVSMNKKIWLLFVFSSRGSEWIIWPKQKARGPSGCSWWYTGGYMVPAGEAAANIGIIKSDLQAIMACVTVKRGHQEAGGLYDRGSILP